MEEMGIEIFEGDCSNDAKRQYDKWIKQLRNDEVIIFVHHIIPSPMPDKFFLTIGYTIV